MTEPEYHKAPHTLDPNQEIPEDAPLSAGNTEEQAEDVKAASEAYTEAVEQASTEDVGPQDPRAPDDASDESQQKREEQEERDAERAGRERDQEAEQDQAARSRSKKKGS
jgi:hypothetical protein